MEPKDTHPLSAVLPLGRSWDSLRAECSQYAMSLTRNRSQADDCVQHAFMQLIKNANALGNIGNVLAYLKTIIRNEVSHQSKNHPTHTDVDCIASSPITLESNIEDDYLAAELTEFIHVKGMDPDIFRYLFAQTILFKLKGKKARAYSANLLGKDQKYLDQKLRALFGNPLLSRQQADSFSEYWDRRGIPPELFFSAMPDFRFFLQCRPLAALIAEVCCKLVESLRKSFYQANNVMRARWDRNNDFPILLSRFASYVDDVFTYAWMPRHYLMIGAIVYLNKKHRTIPTVNFADLLNTEHIEYIYQAVATNRSKEFPSFDRWLATVMLASLYNCDHHSVDHQYITKNLSLIESRSDDMPNTKAGLVFSWLSATNQSLHSQLITDKIAEHMKPNCWYIGLAVAPNTFSTPYLHKGVDAVREAVGSPEVWLYVINALHHKSRTTQLGGLIFLSHMADCVAPISLQLELASALTYLNNSPSFVVREWLKRVPPQYWPQRQ